jgi:bifunctional DNA-binding transcriptional regulator/antitoxin component of YhaV-PrlF toxin-antitoxin module
MSLAHEGVIERDEKGYLIRIPDEIVASLRWQEGDKVKIEMNEWKGRLVIVVYK